MQRVGNAGIHASGRRAWIGAGRDTVLNAEIDTVRAEGAFLCDAQSRQPLIFALELVLHGRMAIGEVFLGDLEARLIGTGHVAVRAADTDVVVDGDDAIRPLPRRS